MNGKLAQMVALVGHGNGFLAGGSEGAPELLGSNSTFRYAHAESWVGEWSVLDEGASDGRIWGVVYRCFSSNERIDGAEGNIEAATVTLATALDDAEQFARQHEQLIAFQHGSLDEAAQ